MPAQTLTSILQKRISLGAPISIAEFMSDALLHPQHGYYTKQDPFGRQGDFITAPEVSQMFGEMLGLWAAQLWNDMGSQDPISIIELGPGRGTLQADFQRAIRKALPDFWIASRVHLVEASPRLRDIQAKSLQNSTSAPVIWHEKLDGVPSGPFILIANEFLDALPIRQFEFDGKAWFERQIGLSPEGEFEFSHSDPLETLPPSLPSDLEAKAEPGDIWETCPAAHDIIETLAERSKAHKGVSLFIDYGHDKSGFGDTFQAIKNHAFANVLQTPGEADLTAHVDFEQLSDIALALGSKASSIESQGKFLTALGIEQRAQTLQATASNAQAKQIKTDLNRLISPGQMGKLFKVLATYSSGLAQPAGFNQGAPG